MGEQRDELAAGERLDAGGGLQFHGGRAEHTVELVMAFLQVGLVAIGAQQLGVGEPWSLLIRGKQPSWRRRGDRRAPLVGLRVLDLATGWHVPTGPLPTSRPSP